MRHSLVVCLKNLALPVVLVLLAGASLQATETREQRGFAPNQVYQVGDLDSVNISNGDVIVRIPIGQQYTAGPSLQYQFVLTYNSKIWDYGYGNVPTDPYADQRFSIPERRSNAGFGWSLSLGRLIVEIPNAPEAWIYVAPDGAEFQFNTPNDPNVDRPPALMYAFSGSYLRLRRLPVSPVQYEIDFPDGDVHTFDAEGRLTKMRDQLGNWVKLDYSTAGKWKITDGYGAATARTHWVDVEDLGTHYTTKNFNKRVTALDLEAFDGARANYTLQYQDDARIGHGTSVGCLPGPLLRSVVLEDDGTSYVADYNEVDPSRCADLVIEDSTAAMRKLTLPTKGSLEWEYGSYQMNAKLCSLSGRIGYRTYFEGITRRTVRDNNGNASVWKYHPHLTPVTFTSFMTCDESDSPVLVNGPEEEFVNVVEAPNGMVTKHYFTAWPDDALQGAISPHGFFSDEFGLPVSRKRMHGTRALSTEVFDCKSVTCARDQWGDLLLTETPVRRTYLEYQRHALLHYGGPYPYFVQEAHPHLVVGQTTEFEIDANGNGQYFTDSESQAFDGYGHFATSITSSTFPSTPTRTSTTELQRTVTADTWLLDMHRDSTLQEGSALAKTRTEFDLTTGLRLSQRAFADPTTESTHDLLTVFCRDNSTAGERGFVTGERFVGGDKTPIPSGDICAIATPAQGHYFLEHEYTFNDAQLTGHKAKWAGTTFYVSDDDFDGGTGLATTSRDTAGIATTYKYDTMGRLEEVHPPAQAWTHYTYDRVTFPARVHVDLWPFGAQASPSGTPLKDDHYYYDGQGRLILSKTRMPGQTPLWATTSVTYDDTGRVVETSVPIATGAAAYAAISPTNKTLFTYDIFDQVRTATAPDGSKTFNESTSYGTRERTLSFVEAGSSDSTKRMRSTEERDGFGRLRTVIEPSGGTSTTHPVGDLVHTDYTYDIADRLTTVTMAHGGVTQHRAFDYDLRGWLNSESHPEKGTLGNGTVHYADYDARGHSWTRTEGSGGNAITTKAVYDSAERMTSLNDASDLPIKVFEFGSANSGGDYVRGKLQKATRHNRLDAGTFIVSETYRYDDPAGRVHQRDTKVEQQTPTGTQAINTFTQTVAYDPDYGAPSTIGYPTCNASGCSMSSGLTSVSQTYDRGLLTGIAGFATLEYHPTGMVKSVLRSTADAALDTYEADHGLPRPSSITFSGGTCQPPAPSTIDANAFCTGSTGSASVPARAGITHAWTITGGTVTSSATGESITFQSNGGGTVTLTVTATNGCGSTAQSSATVTAGAAPTPSTITAATSLCAHAAGIASVPVRPGITHTWVISGGTISSSATGESISFEAGSSGLVILSVKATSACGETTSSKQVIVSPAPTATVSGTTTIPPGATTVIEAALTGIGPWTVVWSDGVTQNDVALTPATRTVQAEARVYSVTGVTDSTGCVGTASGSAQINVSSQPAQRVLGYQKLFSLYSAGHTATLWIDMDPAPSSEHSYAFEWFEDDGTVVRQLNGSLREKIVQPESIGIYWARITGTHGTGTSQYTEVTYSPHMYVYHYGNCELPALHVSQTLGVITGGTPPVTFTASCDWPTVDYQWYQGQTGDTRHAVSSDPNKPDHLTVSSSTIHSYWVRASLDCGAHEDSPTLTFTSGECGPVLIDQNIASKTVAWGTDTSLHVDVFSASAPEYEWYVGAGESSQVLNADQSTLALTNVRKSARYWARVSSGDCGDSADSYLATVRVSSCSTITPPAQWPTEVWTDLGGPATLAASAGGATGYQWYAGEVGDESQLIAGAVQSTYITENLSQETKYWVRIFGSGECVVDSPTITVKVCEPPHLTGSTFNTNQDIVPGQWAAFTIPVTGTALQYRWYQGAPGDTSTPVGESVNKLMVHPNVTTSYWVDVTSTCGVNGGDVRHFAPNPMPVFTASVCPTLAGAPTATKSAVMLNATTTLSIEAGGEALQYRWYVGEPGDTSHPLAGFSASNAITTPPITQETRFWCEVRSGQCSRHSQEIVIRLCELLSLQIHVNNPNVGPGVFQALSVNGAPAEAPLSYQWYQGPAGDTSTPISSQSTAGVSPMATTSYWVRVTTTDTGCFTDSPVLTINVCVPSVTTQPVASTTIDKTSNPSASVHLTVAADIPGVTVQWYIGQPGDTSDPIAAATASSYDASPTATTTYWARVTGSCTTYADSTAATVKVCYTPSISALSPTRSIQQGGSTPISVTATGTNLTYQWYTGESGNPSNPVANSAAPTITVSPASTTTYWVQVRSEGLCSANSATVTVDVCTAPSFTAQPQSRLSFGGNPVTLTAAATSSTGTVSYQWYQGISGDVGTPISGATASSLTVSPTAETTYWVRATASVCSTDSAAATISMCVYPEVITPSTSEKYIGYGATTTLQLPPLSPVDTITVTWYRGASGDRTNIVTSALNLTSYNTAALTSTTQYWAEVTHNTCVSRTTTYTAHVCLAAITTQPTGGTIQSGQSKTLTVETTAISGQTFQWYTGAAGNTTSPVAGATSASLVVNPTTTTTYWVRVTGTCGSPADSAAATVTVCTPPTITGISASPAAIQQGSSTTLSVSATAVNKTYQWYIGPSGTTSSPVTNGTGGSIVVSPASTTTYWVQVKSEGFCTSNSPGVTVDVCTTPVITTQPLAQSIRIGQSATLTVATSTSGATYQWYQGAPGTTTTPLGTTSNITVTPTADTQYWARVTRGACSIDSSGATVTVCALTAAVANVNAASGQNATMTATVTNARAAVTYWWYLGNSGTTTTLVASGNVPSMTVNRTVTTNYWVRVSDGTCTVDSATATLNVCIPTITTQPQSVTITSGQSTTLTVAATGAPLTYQWYVGDSGVTTSPISGATAASYTTPALTTLTKYWVRASGCATANSATATVTVCIPPSTPSAPTKSTTMYPGNAAWVSIDASGTGLTYQWYKGQSGDTTRPISGATSATYNFTLSVSEYYWVRVTGTCGTPASSAATLYSVMPTITVQPQSPSVPTGSSATLSVTATGNFLTYQWYNAANQAISGATSATYTTPPITTTTLYTVRVSSGSLTVNSDQATVTNCVGPGVSFSAVHHTTHSWTLIMTVTEGADLGLVKYQWYIGTPGSPSQSTPQGTVTSQSQWYLSNVTQAQTWWVRAWYTDDHCYSDTQGIAVD